MNLYDIDYFIDKFEAIPEDRWVSDKYFNPLGQCCAVGHCGIVGPEALALKVIFVKGDTLVERVNYGADQRFQQPTPKQRILAALHHIKNQTT
jgi:hypothetical protein